MPTWGEILNELNETAGNPGQPPDWDAVRRKYLAKLHDLTGRDTIVYYTNWMVRGGPDTAIVIEDMQGMMEANKDLHGPELDLILHSPGGQAEATASMVRYLRKKFTDIRVFVPLAAMSAASMWALSGNEIVMGKHSQLGPIDPQMLSPHGASPARGIIKQFERAKKECAEDPAVLGAWMPMLQQYGPSLLEECDRAENLSKALVTEWLAAYMFAGNKDPMGDAQKVAGFFAEYGAEQSHSLGIDRELARAQGLAIRDLESDEDLQDAILSVHHATLLTFQGLCVKIVENHLGRAWAKLVAPMQLQMQPELQMTPPTG